MPGGGTGAGAGAGAPGWAGPGRVVRRDVVKEMARPARALPVLSSLTSVLEATAAQLVWRHPRFRPVAGVGRALSAINTHILTT